MQIRVNEEAMTLEQPLTLSALLEQLACPHNGTAIALNQSIVPRERWATWLLQDADELLIFQAIAGG